MLLRDLAEIKINFKEADFWVVRRGSIETVGSVSRIFNPEHFGVKVIRIDILVPDYLYYAIMHLHSTGQFKMLCHGTLSLVNIRVDDLKDIKLV